VSRRTILGSTRIGVGPDRVIVLNDWLADTTSWAPMRPLLDTDRYAWAFADLRGYGASREMAGAYTLAEAAHDALRLADSLGWGRFTIVGHSMSSLIALHLAQTSPDRIARAIVLTPPPPGGLGADAATVAYLQQLAMADDAARLEGLAAMWGDRLGPRWPAFKARQWRAAAASAAACGYVEMFASGGLPDLTTPIEAPVLAVTGEEDAEVMRAEAVTQHLGALCRDLRVEPLVACGHYPMQECPPRLCEVLERFLATAEPLERPVRGPA
jgi:pimeloyl-ACP methyl ester carboxylesterase